MEKNNTYIGIVLSGYQLMIGEIDTAGNILRMKEYRLNFFNQESALEIIKTSLDDSRSAPILSTWHRNSRSGRASPASSTTT